MKFIETWNRAAEVWSAHVLEAGLASLVLLVVVQALWLLLRRRVSASTGFALFLLPLIPLVVPRLDLFELRVPLSTEVARFVPNVEIEPASTASLEGAAGVDASTSLAPTRVVPEVEGRAAVAEEAVIETTAVEPGTAPRPTAFAWLLLTWGLVVLTLLSRFLLVQLRTQRLVRAARPLCEDDLARVRGLLAPRLARQGLEYTVSFVESEAVTSPAAWGVGRSTVVLPPGLVARLDDEALAWILLHEVAHLERHDLWIAGVQRVVQILWFFHPGVWFTDRVVDELRECACDEAALVRCPGSKRRHLAEALLDVAAAGSRRRAPRLALQTLQKDSLLMKKRILRMIDPGTPARAGLALGVVPMLLVVAALPLVSVRLEGAPQDGDPRARAEAVPGQEQAEAAPASEREARLALTRSLQFLLAWQRSDGHFPMGPTTDKDAGEFNKVGVTGFVIEALVEAEREGGGPEFRAAIDRALGYLELELDEETGLFGGVDGHRYMASHGVATRAWILGHMGQPEATWKPQAELALAAIYRARNPYAAWRFSHLPDGDNDTFTSSLMLLALAAARDAGIEVDMNAVEQPLYYFDELYDVHTGRTGYNATGSRPPRLAGRGEDYPAEYSEMATAIVICARLAWDQSPMETDAIRRGAAVLGDVAPTWNRERGTIDFYSWMFGSRAMAQLGGFQADHWRAKLLDALIEHQRTDKEGRVWWPAVGAWHGENDSVHSTVMLTLALQAVLD